MKMVMANGAIHTVRYGSPPALSNICILIKEVSNNTLGTAKPLIYSNIGTCF
jgi:hypothetical protein